MDNRPIGVFDSGLGGLNVLKELKKKLPNENFIYLGDTKRFPYGSKSKEAIIQISKENVEFLINKDVKLVIIACGTATSQALDSLKEEYDIPIIGIIEPTILNMKERINNDSEVTIGIIATKGTIRSGAWENTILKYIPDASVINQSAPLLATMAEEGWINNKVAEYTVKEYMKKFDNVNKLILGCTHYPLFAQLMKKELKSDVEIIDTGVELANYLENWLMKNEKNSEKKNGEDKIYLTDIEDNFLNMASLILDSISNVEKIEINKI